MFLGRSLKKVLREEITAARTPRITKIDDRYYMCYTAYDGYTSPRVALSSISVADYLAGNWNWTKPQLISPPGIDDKDACLFPRGR